MKRGKERETQQRQEGTNRGGEERQGEKLLQGLLRILISDDDQRLVVRHSRIHHA
jgi:hypothetical protein